MSQGRADGIFAVAKLVKVICLTKFYDFFLCINPFYRLFSGFFGCFLGVEVTQLLIIPIIFRFPHRSTPVILGVRVRMNVCVL